MTLGAERARLDEDARRTANWKRWGPYLSERQWATVREDYSPDGGSWRFFPHDHARSRAYRWGEDGLLGITDRECRLCFALALWNGKDPILKERLFGLTGEEGNHGEDVKEVYFYVDATPTSSYLRALYKYPQREFPYRSLLAGNLQRGKDDPELELLDTGAFDGGAYFDVQVEYAKGAPDDVLIRVTVSNRGSERAALHLLPTLWFRNTWSWGAAHEASHHRPSLRLDAGVVLAEHETLGRFRLAVGDGPDGSPPPLLFTENETNRSRLWGVENRAAFLKDAFHEYLVEGRRAAVNPAATGTKLAAHYALSLGAGESQVVQLRLVADGQLPAAPLGPDFDRIFAQRREEADAFYASVLPPGLSDEERRVARQAYAGLLWSKQYYEYIVEDWLEGDSAEPPPPEARKRGRNRDWGHLYCRDVISMPDKWEYPWFAAWDLAFQMLPMASLDPDFAKSQLVLFLREWYMHPNGQLPAYEFQLDDVNPPVHAWAAWRVYKISGKRGARDRDFLESVFQKLLLNFTWWVNRKDVQGRNLFSGGFLGLDNIGLFNRSEPLPSGGVLQEADATGWMAFYCATMLNMALELAHDGAHLRTAYEDMASKFLEHFVQIADAINTIGGSGLWDEEDGFYYDQVSLDDRSVRLRTRSAVGLLPLLAVEVLEDRHLERLPGFRKRLAWFLRHRQDLAGDITHFESRGPHRLIAIPSRRKLERVLRYVLDEDEFLSPHGIRSLSKYHGSCPCELEGGGAGRQVTYEPAESRSGLFGGNSNWRGPVWFPINYLLVEALERYHHFYGDTLQVECPLGSGRRMTLREVAHDLSARLASLFLPGADGRRPWHGADGRWAQDPHWRGLELFHEYFHGDTGQGLGASHQTGWTALVVRLMADVARARG